MIITKTPYRISFLGGGTDHPSWYKKYGGSVLSTTINKYCYVTCRYLPPYFKETHRIVYSKVELTSHTNEIEHPLIRESIKHANIKGGLEIHHQGDVPGWSGVGTSSSFTVGLLKAFYALKGRMVDSRKLALDAIKVEQKKVKDTVGSQDQVAASFGGLNRIDFLPNGKINVNPVILLPKRLSDFQNHLLLFFTGIVRRSSDIEKEKVATFPQKKETLIKMAGMVDKGVKILKNGDLNDFGKLMHEAWMLKKTFSSQISNSEINKLYNGALQAGAIGGKLLGAGGGGFFLLFVSPGKHRAVRNKMKQLNFMEVPFKFESEGSKIILYNSNLI
mgnify:CR=1 FL=1